MESDIFLGNINVNSILRCHKRKVYGCKNNYLNVKVSLYELLIGKNTSAHSSSVTGRRCRLILIQNVGTFHSKGKRFIFKKGLNFETSDYKVFWPNRTEKKLRIRRLFGLEYSDQAVKATLNYTVFQTYPFFPSDQAIFRIRQFRIRQFLLY